MPLVGQWVGLHHATKVFCPSEAANVDIEASVSDASLSIVLCDLSLQADVRRAAEDIEAKYEWLDLLVNNAGIMFRSRQVTTEGVEMMLAVNHVGPFPLTTLLLPPLQAPAPLCGGFRASGRAQTFLRAVVGDSLETLWVVMINTGLRRGEALALTWDDLDLDAKTLSVSNALVQIGGVPTLSQPKTQRSYRTISLDSTTVQALKEHRKNQRRLRFSAEQWTDAESVFTTSTGQPPRPDYAHVCFKRIVTREGLPWIRLHGLRHTHASLLILAGVDVATVSERLGHADVGITVRTYLHGSVESDREAAASFERLIAI